MSERTHASRLPGWLAFVASVTFAFGWAACGGSDPPRTQTSDDVSEDVDDADDVPDTALDTDVDAPPLDATPQEDTDTTTTDATDATSDSDADTSLPREGCTRVPAILSEYTTCTRDDDCPCGAHCDLGVCASTCDFDTDCNDAQVCDIFGRCTSAAMAGRIPPVSAANRGLLWVDRSLVELLSPDAVQTFRVRARLHTINAVRILADDGVEISCGEEGDWGAECLFGPVHVDSDAWTVAVRRSDTTSYDEDVRHAVRVVTANGRHVVGVRIPRTPVPQSGSRNGVYEGIAQIVGAGLRSRSSSDELPTELRQLRIPIHAVIHPQISGEYVAELSDERNTVFAPGALGTLSFDSARDWQLEVARTAFLDGSPDDGSMTIFATGSMRDATFTNQLLNGEYTSTFEGIGVPGQEPFVRWQISMVRVGDLPAGSARPTITPAPAPTVATTATTPFPEEAVVLSALSIGSLDASVAERILCSNPGLLITELNDSHTYGFGDLSCDAPGNPPQRAFAVPSGPLTERGRYLRRCVEGLRGDDGLALGDASATGECIDAARAITALSAAIDTDRSRALGEGLPETLDDSRLALRILQQWVSVQSIAAADPRRVYRLAPLLPAGPDTSELRAYGERDSVVDALNASIRAWDVVLHPRIASGLLSMSPTAISNPDYRGAIGVELGGEQRLGVPVVFLYTLTEQMHGFEGLIDDVLHARAPASEANVVAAHLRDLLPRTVVIFAFSQGLYDAARSVGVPTWQSAWEAARVSYGTSINRMLRSLDFLESGANPLGIDDFDLPLYRLGDQTGVSSRFTAVSDNLLGRDDRLQPSISETLINQAEAARTEVQASIVQLLARDIATELQLTASERRLEDIRRRFGEAITSLCGHPDQDSFLVLDDDVDPNTCFLNEGCSFSPQDFADRLNIADLGYEVCVAAKMRERFGDAVSTGQAEIDRQLDIVSGSFGASTPFFSIDTIQSIGEGFRLAYQGVDTRTIAVPGGIDSETIREIESLCESGRQLTLEARPTTNPTTCEETDDCAVGFYCRSASGSCEPDTQEVDPSCYYGSLGEIALAMQASSTDVDIARSELEEFSERYDTAMRSCILQQQLDTIIGDALASHNATMNQLAAAKLASDITAITAEGVRNALQSQGSPWQIVGSVIAGGVEVAAKSTSATIANRMEMAERSHELTMHTIQAEGNARICFNEAEAELVGVRSATLRIRRQTEELAQLMVQFRNLQISVDALMDEGNAALENETARARLPAYVDFWLDYNIDRYETRLRRARRALYLAMIALEYEFQFTSIERGNILRAADSSELNAIRNRLQDITRRGAPFGGGSPTELITVLSLRQNLMQLADRSDFDPGWHALSETERFQRILASPRYAAYNDRGDYVGQEIPFTIQPFGSIDLGDSGAIPLLSGLNCAERLWYVNATVIGDNLMNRTETSIVTIQLRQRNTFASQWCDPSLHEESVQVVSTRPSRNLFVDPFSALSWNADATLAELTNTREVSAFSRATIQARTNVERRTFDSVGYADGRSQAMAGRGVFGDYTLFFPATTQSIDGSTGLIVENIEDVLIRLDYVAAETR